MPCPLKSVQPGRRMLNQPRCRKTDCDVVLPLQLQNCPIRGLSRKNRQTGLGLRERLRSVYSSLNESTTGAQVRTYHKDFSKEGVDQAALRLRDVNLSHSEHQVTRQPTAPQALGSSCS